jgi:hypothetical protein
MNARAHGWLLAGALVLALGGQAQAAAPDPASFGFTVPAGDPLAADGAAPADVLGPGGAPVLLCDDLGLACLTAPNGGSDEILGLSFGHGPWPGAGAPVVFSVAAGSRGAAGSAVRAEADCATPEPQADMFGAADGSNQQVLDGDGLPCGSNDAPGLGVQEAGVASDIRAVTPDPCLSIDLGCDGLPEAPVFVTLAAGSPTLADAGASPADVLIVSAGDPPAVYAPAADLGLAAGDAINALCVWDYDGDGAHGAGDRLVFALAPGSPTLAALSAGAADLLAPGQPPSVFRRAASLGLEPSDEIDGLMCDFDLARAFMPVVRRAGP